MNFNGFQTPGFSVFDHSCLLRIVGEKVVIPNQVATYMRRSQSADAMREPAYSAN